MNTAILTVSTFAALGAIGAFIVAWAALTKSDATSKMQIALQSQLTAIEEERRSEEVELRSAEIQRQRLLPASAVQIWDESTGSEATIFVHNTSNESVHDVVCWAWPLLMDAPDPEPEEVPASWPDFPDFPITQYLWVGSIGPGEKKSVEYRPTPEEVQFQPIGTLYEVEFTDGKKRHWNRSHDGTLMEDFRRPYAC